MSISLVLFALAAILVVLAYFLPRRRILCGAVLALAIGNIIQVVGVRE